MGWQAPLCDLLLSLGRSARVIVLFLCVGGVLGLVAAFIRPHYYRASAVVALLPREKPVVDTSIRTSSLATSEDRAQRESTGSLMLPGQPELYLAILRSRPILRALVDRYRHRLDFGPSDNRSDEEVDALQRKIQLEATEDGLLTITITALSPDLAADLANALVSEGKAASAAIERQLLMQQAGHLEQALDGRRRALLAAEQALEVFCERNRVVDLGVQATQDLVLLKETSAKRDQLQLNLSVLRERYTERDPKVLNLCRQVTRCERTLSEIRARTGGPGERGFGRLRVAYRTLSENVRLTRDMVATLSLQAELFRLRAEQPAGCLAVIRTAVPVEKPAGPSKKRTLGVALGLALVLGVAWALAREQLRLAELDPYLAARLNDLRALCGR
jgi:uncharacterized protein involved in exopolysaccharide biosynthesis